MVTAMLQAMKVVEQELVNVTMALVFRVWQLQNVSSQEHGVPVCLLATVRRVNLK